MVSKLARAVQGRPSFKGQRIHARGAERCEIPSGCQWSASQEIFPKYVGRWTVRYGGRCMHEIGQRKNKIARHSRCTDIDFRVKSRCTGIDFRVKSQCSD